MTARDKSGGYVVIFKSFLAASISIVALIAGGVSSFAQADLDALYKAAKTEGQLTTIALPHTWCGYGGVISGFKAKYPGITLNELNPDAGSADELEAVRANKGNTGPQAPDVIDVGLAFGPQAAKDGLIQPYKVSTWNEIPADAKDAGGHWYGDYYGVMAILVNTDIISKVPADWKDLLDPAYANAVALSGDPRAAAQAVQAVYAAGLSETGKDDGAAKAGLKFFGDLNAKSNFVPVIGKAASIAQGSTPVLIGWDYNLFAWRDSFKGNPQVKIVVPQSQVLAGVYIQAISAYAPHPNAAKLWMEYLYSDEGQLGWLKGYCHPIRFNALAKAGKISKELLDALPPPENYAKAVFPTIEQQNAAKQVITKEWDSAVGANVK